MQALVRSCFCRFWIAICLAFFCRASAADEFVFANSLSQGLKKAAKSKRLLIVVQTTGEFIEPPFRQPLAQAFQLLTLHDEAVVAASQSRCIFVCEAINRPFRSRGPAKGETQPIPNDRMAIYFCTPDGLVLHVLTGAIGSQELLAALDWSERIYRDMLGKPEDQTTIAAGWHALRLAEPALQNQLPNRKGNKGSGEIKDEYLEKLVDAAWRIHGQQLQARFGSNFSDEQRAVVIAEVAKHGEPRTDFPHLLLCNQPLIPIQRLAPIITNVCLQSEFWRVSSRRDPIAKWVDTKHRDSLSILLIVRPNDESAPWDSRSVDDSQWKARSERLSALVKEVAVTEISASELAALMVDHTLDSQQFPTSGFPRYAIISPFGEMAAIFAEKADESDVVRVLERFTKASLSTDFRSDLRGSTELHP